MSALTSIELDRLDRTEARVFIGALLERHLTFVETYGIRESLLSSIHSVAADRAKRARQAETEAYDDYCRITGEHSRLDPVRTAERVWRRSRDAVERSRDLSKSATRKAITCDRAAAKAWAALEDLWASRHEPGGADP